MLLTSVDKSFRIAFLVFIALFFSSCSFIKPAAEEKQHTMSDITGAVSANNYAVAYREVKSLNVTGMDAGQVAAVDFVKAFLSYKTGGYKEAISGFRELQKKQMIFQDYISWYLANSYINAGDFNRAIPYLETIAASYTESVFYKQSIQLHAQCLSELKLYSDAKNIYARYMTMPAFYNQDAVMQTAIAALDISMGDLQGGIKNYTDVYTRFPGSVYAGIAFSALSTITDTSKLKIDHYQIAKLLMIDGKYSAALNYLNLAVHEMPSDTDKDRMPLLYRDIGIAYYNIGRYNDAVHALRTAIYYDTARRSYTEVLFWLGKAFIKLGQTDSALNTFIQVAYMKGTYAPMAMYKLYSLYSQDNDTEHEKQWLLKLADTDTPFALSAYWQLGWIYYTSGNFKEAVRYFGKIKDSKYSDQYESIKADYWTAKVLLKQGKDEIANERFFHIANSMPVSYYTVMANMWLGVNTLSYDPSSLNVPEPAQTEPAFAYHYSRYRFLKSIGINGDAMYELSALKQMELTYEETLLLCREYYANGDYYNTLYTARTRLGDMLQTFTQSALPVWYYSYPSGYSYLIGNYARRYSLDPAVVYAIILQESKYKTDAVSDSGALGIMQIMPYTGAKVAKDIALAPFSSQLLFDPQINIGIGIWYFKQLMTKYKDNYVLSLAAYNAGTKAVAKWLATSNACNTDEFIEEIPFSETRHYVKGIIANLAAYAMINGGDFSLEKHIYMEGSFLKSCLPK
jgi:peptidoglycan lytic transglycosylase